MKPERLKRRHLRRAGRELVAFDSGNGGIPVVLQHGLCGSVQQTAEAFPDDPGLRLLTLDCPGHGGTPAVPPAGISIAAFADDVIALIEHAALAPVILGGISMGAAVSLRIAVRRPDLVRGLILARPAWVTGRAPDNMRPNLEVGELLAAHPPAEARALFEQGPTAQRLARTAPDNLTSLLGFFDRAPQAETAALLQRISLDGPEVLPAEVRALTVPTLVIGHGADAIHPWSHAQALAALLPHNSQLVEITPKSVSREAYVADMHAALSAFIQKVSS